MRDKCNILIVGGGVVGLATAARLASCGRTVIVLDERERAPIFGGICAPLEDPLSTTNADVRALAAASATMLRGVPDVFRHRTALHLFLASALDCCAKMYASCLKAGVTAEALEQDEIVACYPYLGSGGMDAAMALSLSGPAFDTDALCRYLRSCVRACGGKICFGESLETACYDRGLWAVSTTKRRIDTDMIVNCAEGCADEVAKRCGARMLGLKVVKQSCIDVSLAPECQGPAQYGPILSWQEDCLGMCCDFRPGGRVRISTSEAYIGDSEVEPGAGWAAATIACFEERTGLRATASDAPAQMCLQNCAPDGRPAVGWARETPGFFWCAAMGDFGFRCAPAIAAMACDMILNRSDFTATSDRCGVCRDCVCPDRLGPVGVLGS